METNKRPHCLLTGASGFIASRLAQGLASNGCELTGVDLRRAKGSPYSRFFEADITRPLDPQILSGVDTVYHLAGKVHALSEVKSDDAEYFRINTEGTRNLLEAARQTGVRRFVFFSTIKAMSGEENLTDGPPERPLSESDQIAPETPYGKSKLEAERLVLTGGYVPESVVLRLCMVYGAGAKGNMQKMLSALSRNRFPPVPEFGNRRSMVHVADVVQAAMLAGQKKEAIGQVFIVSDGRVYSTRQMYELLCRGLNRKCPAITTPLWFLRGLGIAGDVIGKLRGRRFIFDSDALAKLAGSAWFDSRKIEATLGFRPQYDLAAAVPEMVEELRMLG